MFGYTIDNDTQKVNFTIYKWPKGIIELKIHKYDFFLPVCGTQSHNSHPKANISINTTVEGYKIKKGKFACG